MKSMRVILAGMRAQLQMARVNGTDFILTVLVQPIIYSLVFLLVLKASNKLETLLPFAVIAPVLIGMWSTALNIAGETISSDRNDGILELLVITPNQGLTLVLLGRIIATIGISLVAMAESLLIASWGFGLRVEIGSPLAFGLLLLLTALSIAAAALIMASTFVLARSARLFQNLLSFPFYLLGGISFPISILPLWLRPFSQIVSLRWGAEGLRASLEHLAVPWMTYLILTGLTVGYGILGMYLLRLIERKIRHNGSIVLG